MFLSDAELLELTGYQRHADQRRWLSSRGWLFEESRTGRPVIGRSYAEQRTGALLPPQAQKRAWKPNIAAIQKRV